MMRCDTVFHLAALLAIPYSYIAHQVNIDTNIHGTLNVLQAARDLEISRFVHTSTSEVYGDNAICSNKRGSSISWTIAVFCFKNRRRSNGLELLVKFFSAYNYFCVLSIPMGQDKW